MQLTLIHKGDEFVRTPVLEHRAFFTCVQCRYCGYLVLGGSGKELQEEKGRHAIECKATHRFIAVISQRGRRQKPHILQNTRVLKWSRSLFVGIARLCAILARFQSLRHRPFLSCAAFRRSRADRKACRSDVDLRRND